LTAIVQVSRTKGTQCSNNCP